MSITETGLADDVGADFDHWDDISVNSPWERWARLRAADPLPHSDKHGGFYIASSYADVCAIARETSVFSSSPQTAIPDKPAPPFPPMNFDPPQSRSYRAIINPRFAPKRIAECEPWIREYVDSYVGDLLGRDHFNVPLDLGMPLTRDVILRLMGITDPPAELNQLADDLIYHESAEAALQIMVLLAGEVEKRRTDPQDDLITDLIGAPFEDRELDDEEILGMALLLLLAGLETTNSAISGAIWYLVRNPEAQEFLRQADDIAWTVAVEEMIRWTSPAPALARNIHTETSYRGCPMKPGDKVLLLFGSANRDETEFTDPDRLVLDRHPNRHLGFGIGPHRCIGSHLAKREMILVLKALLPGLGDFELRHPDKVKWNGNEVRGIRSLPLVRRGAPDPIEEQT